MRVEQHGNDVGAAGLQALGGTVGRIADCDRHLANPPARVGGDLRRFGKGARNGGDRKPGDLRNRSKGRLAPSGGRTNVFGTGGLGGIGQC
ncbi:hypothetical protein D3C72_2279460 [compost metagenome]